MVPVKNPYSDGLCPQEHLAALPPNLMGKMTVMIAGTSRMTDTVLRSCLDSLINSPSEVSATLPSS